ncbi:hypothetical protein BABINDRAFT_163465 [Babjeviella inositovora NRRL Y-12698]|uniref:Uncharacterized protein n=1 Tax=Babjeviella inositovora NRRL Y-12698 TaxID=984486 RepID=A0A1E3QJ22_9ASCO|nr:uncharacterized protein BABINDRAFT_163465 [Babjeviella inositovora NRRL Y-12698]ODQ77444.1 hypothetical protein BABINDRAFT_163465 [Babjeviella inositovora NRRL Y-12698]
MAVMPAYRYVQKLLIAVNLCVPVNNCFGVERLQAGERPILEAQRGRNHQEKRFHVQALGLHRVAPALLLYQYSGPFSFTS